MQNTKGFAFGSLKVFVMDEVGPDFAVSRVPQMAVANP
jgi:hypothetical protein